MVADFSHRWMTAVADAHAMTIGSLWRSLTERFNVFNSIFSTAFNVFGKSPSLFFKGPTAACVFFKDFLKGLQANSVAFKPCIESSSFNPSVENILTYNYCLRDVIINYSLIAVMQITVLVHRLATISIVLSTLYLWIFQVALCRGMGCVGVSVVWSAQMGILFHYRQRGQSKSISTIARCWYYTSMTCGIAAWMYYAAIAEPLTTVAHLCSMAKGLLLDMALQLCEPPGFPPLPPLPLPPSIVFTGDEYSGGGDETLGESEFHTVGPGVGAYR